jgi:hypothetical protein
VPEIVGNRDIGVGAQQELADGDFAIACAAFAVAETGSVLLSESELHVNALAYELCLVSQHRMHDNPEAASQSDSRFAHRWRGLRLRSLWPLLLRCLWP